MAHVFTEANFQTEVVNSPVPVLVDFWAAWCGPCIALAPTIEELAQEIPETSLKIGKLNVDEEPAVAERYRIMSIPTLHVFKGGEVVETLVGFMSRDELKAALAKWM